MEIVSHRETNGKIERLSNLFVEFPDRCNSVRKSGCLYVRMVWVSSVPSFVPTLVPLMSTFHFYNYHTRSLIKGLNLRIKIKRIVKMIWEKILNFSVFVFVNRLVVISCSNSSDPNVGPEWRIIDTLTPVQCICSKTEIMKRWHLCPYLK